MWWVWSLVPLSAVLRQRTTEGGCSILMDRRPCCGLAWLDRSGRKTPSAVADRRVPGRESRRALHGDASHSGSPVQSRDAGARAPLCPEGGRAARASTGSASWCGPFRGLRDKYLVRRECLHRRFCSTWETNTHLNLLRFPLSFFFFALSLPCIFRNDL